MTHKGIISIPSELITEILYRLPSKSIGRFRCVSKEWLSLLSSPQFIKTHQNTLNRNYVFFSSKLTEPYFTPFHYHEEEEEESLPTMFQLQSHNVNPTIHASCNGLVLLSAFCHYSGHETLIISNPTTREFVELPDCDLNSVLDIMCELGYDSMSDDYKVVTINLNSHDYIMCVHVYSLRRNTWTRLINYPDKYCLSYIRSEALVNRSFHWVATKVSDETKVIVAFSLADENFSEVPLPTLGNDVDIVYKLVVVEEKLAICSVFEGELWLMNEYGVKGSWTKIKLNGLKDIPMLVVPFVLYVNGELLLVWDDEMVIYDIKDGRLTKHIDNCGNTYLRASNFECICVESLVSPSFKRLNLKSTSSSEGMHIAHVQK